MELYLVRHAIAVSSATPGIPDEERVLTEEGIRKMRQAAGGLRALGYIPDLLLTSPLIRALQTAEILLEAFGKTPKLKVLPALAPYGSRQDLYAAVVACGKKLDRLMLVGHQPSLGEIAGDIIGASPKCLMELKKGGACAIEVSRGSDPPKGSLVSLLTPSILRRIAGEPRIDL